MDGAIQFNGLVGIIMLFASMIVWAVMILIVAAVHFLRMSRGPGVKKHLLYPSMILLIINAFVFLSIALATDKIWTNDEAVAFDELMLFIWIPSQIVVYVLLAVIVHCVGSRKAEISELVEKLR